jgi:predicted Zn-dependent protease
MSLRLYLKNIIILLLLLALILIPRPVAGRLYQAEALRLDQAGQPALAARSYIYAAERLPWNASLWEQAGDAYLQAEAYAEAKSAYARASSLRALSVQGTIRRGDALLALGETQPSIDLWTAAFEKGADPLDLWPRLARAYRSLGDLLAELHALQEYAAVQSQDAPAQYRLGILLAAFSPAEALPHLLQAVQLDSSLDNPVETMRTALNTAMLSDDPAYQYLLSGRGLAALNEWNLAEISFQHAVDSRPTYAEAWAWLAEAKQQQGQPGTAEIEKAVSLNPNSAIVQGLFGFYLTRQDQPVRALGSFRIAAALEPNDPRWQIAVGRAYEGARDLIQALTYYQRATRMAPQDPSTWKALAEFCLRNSDSLAEIGLPAARKMLELDGEDWQAVDLAGQILMELENHPGAEAMLKKAAELAPDQAAPRLHLGLLYLQIGDRQSAYENILQALELDPEGTYGWQAQRLLEQYFP